jgi:lipoprotein signal peptidase
MIRRSLLLFLFNIFHPFEFLAKIASRPITHFWGFFANLSDRAMRGSVVEIVDIHRIFWPRST